MLVLTLRMMSEHSGRKISDSVIWYESTLVEISVGVGFTEPNTLSVDPLKICCEQLYQCSESDVANFLSVRRGVFAQNCLCCLVILIRAFQRIRR